VCHYVCIDKQRESIRPFGVSGKKEYLQIRMSASEKARLRRFARAAGQDLSSYVLERALPRARTRFQDLLSSLGKSEEARYALAELNDLLSGLPTGELEDTVSNADVRELTPFHANYVAAMIEQACGRAGVDAPPWTRTVEPLERPHFAVSLRSLRPYLLRASPVPFKRRNIFIDVSLGGRV
jgi:hypothetical protein